MEASTSAGVILKIIECENEIHSKELLELTRNLRKQADIRLYDYKIDYRGIINSADYWNDLSLLTSSGLIMLIEDTKDIKLAITERGSNKINELELELPSQIIEALPVCRRK